MYKKIVGIIAEFNPLHSGHEFLIKSSKKILDSEACIVILSSNFTQRGSPALIDKFFRAEMAISAGADLVIELPFVFSCSASSDFSESSVNLLANTNFASHLAFGMEDPDFDFSKIIKILINEPEEYKIFLHNSLKNGCSYPKAVSLTLENFVKGSEDFISKPNNMLAISYILQIQKFNLNLIPLKIKREGNFNSKNIRNNIKNNHEISNIPEYSKKILKSSKISGRLCSSWEDNFWLILQSLFIKSSNEDLRKIHGINEGIENLFLKNFKIAKNLNDFIKLCVSSRYTSAHIRRRLVYLITGLDRYSFVAMKRIGVPYARILAFNKTGRKILKNYSDNSNVQIITRLAEAKSKIANYITNMEFKASQLYELMLKNPDMNRETRSVLKF